MVAYIKATLLGDWQDINFVIGTNPDDMIEIKFDGKTVDTTAGLHAYMNTLMNNNLEIQSYGLRRIIHYWGFKEKKHIYYMLAPSWVRVHVNDIMNYYKDEHLESKSSFDSDSESEGFQKKQAERAMERKPKLYSREIVLN